MRKTDSVGLDRPSLNKGDILNTNMSFPDSIRMEPIRLPRATILRNTPIFDISEERETFFEQAVRSSPPIPRISPSSKPVEQPPTQAFSTVTDGVLNGTATGSDLHTMTAKALDSNCYLGCQRFVFIVAKYPALVMAMVALWNVTGRGRGMAKSSTEEAAFYAALATAAVVLVSQILFQTNHHHCYKKARVMSILYHLSMVVAFCTAAACVVLAGVNLHSYSGESKIYTCKYQNNAPCYTTHQRLTYLATLVGCGGIIVILAVLTFIYGAVGQSVMKKRLSEEYKKEAHQQTYENHAFQY
ncbi:unnamed protein product [Nippostrongylus brasiliensis]|uniref:G_PROTEIN_RECEP_F2_4 domain-containing protein n=1 Tax=Nippostrongylus brasiliensis TaxID=27835 RepID=A0A0N4YHZ5_NIPBR|nr:unnamed protein product [Nippostrongylus brasiliensis]